jgi:hypothetical protein
MHFHDLKIWHYLSKTQQKNGDEVPNRSGGDAGTGLNKCRPLNIACVLVSSVPQRKKKLLLGSVEWWTQFGNFIA